ncbi:hypothetical protein HYDPIDRAFT_118933 [Hydnomerulius pinastri MD-312]|uniref:Ribosomal protein L27 n=1 Tax=Hydnomerulius pinastri MD-312 TaxID=994086 RepID=A0A0C9W8E5_9AGAM|nr:hypothetical protein HYDPIDRAFT_118933 [Hydnomerulius pinastri MD-312]
MHPTAAVLSKASRRALTPKRGNKDFYKGTRQATLPGGHRTGAPGRFVIRGSAKYRLLDEKVRVFVGPPAEEISRSELKPYVHADIRLSTSDRRDLQLITPILPGTKIKQWRRDAEASSGKEVAETTVAEGEGEKGAGVMAWLKGKVGAKGEEAGAR